MAVEQRGLKFPLLQLGRDPRYVIGVILRKHRPRNSNHFTGGAKPKLRLNLHWILLYCRTWHTEFGDKSRQRWDGPMLCGVLLNGAVFEPRHHKRDACCHRTGECPEIVVRSAHPSGFPGFEGLLPLTDTLNRKRKVCCLLVPYG